VDGEYGPNTQRALQNVLDAIGAANNGPSQAAPTNCFPELGAVPTVPALDVTPTPTPATPAAVMPTVTPPASMASMTPWIIGGAAVAGAGVVGYAYWRKHKRSR